jgi:hypothetical protein
MQAGIAHGHSHDPPLLPANPSSVRRRYRACALRKPDPAGGRITVIELDTDVISELMRPLPEPRVPPATRNMADFAEIGLELIDPWDWP